MRKFKVGDRVKIVYGATLATGQTGIITKIDEYYHVTYDSGNSYGSDKWANDTSLELLLREPTDNISYEERVAYWLQKLD
jgi:hypothetical protein